MTADERSWAQRQARGAAHRARLAGEAAGENSKERASGGSVAAAAAAATAALGDCAMMLNLSVSVWSALLTHRRDDCALLLMKLAAADGDSASCDVVKAASVPRQMEAARTGRTLNTPGGSCTARGRGAVDELEPPAKEPLLSGLAEAQLQLWLVSSAAFGAGSGQVPWMLQVDSEEDATRARPLNADDAEAAAAAADDACACRPTFPIECRRFRSGSAARPCSCS